MHSACDFLIHPKILFFQCKFAKKPNRNFSTGKLLLFLQNINSCKSPFRETGTLHLRGELRGMSLRKCVCLDVELCKNSLEAWPNYDHIWNYSRKGWWWGRFAPHPNFFFAQPPLGKGFLMIPNSLGFPPFFWVNQKTGHVRRHVRWHLRTYIPLSIKV